MRLAILAHNLRVGGGTVVGRSIVATLPRVAPEHDYLMVVPARCGFDPRVRDAARSVRWVEVGFSSLLDRWRVERSVVPGVLRSFAPDWVWALGNVPLRRPGCRQALLVMDPHLFYPPRHYALETARNRAAKGLLRRHVARTLRDVDVVFCQTSTAARRFAESFGFAGRVEVCPAAVSELAAWCDGFEMPEALRGHETRFKVLILTRYYAHKNLERVVEAFLRFPELLEGVTCVLTIAAEQHPRAARLLDAIRARGLGDRIVNLGPLRPEQLAAAYLSCDALLHPTLLESFSSAYLEAMHFERPILTSDLDFAREVCGDAARYVDPWRAESIARGIAALRDDPAGRAELVRRGTARLTSHLQPWPDVVRHVLHVLADAGRASRTKGREAEPCRSGSIRAGAVS